MGNWSPARVIAPLALIAAVVGVLVVFQAAKPGSDDSSGQAATTQTQQRRGARRKRRTYVVKAGDNLTLIAERAKVPLDRILRLNPGLDAQTLTVGQRLKLTR